MSGADSGSVFDLWIVVGVAVVVAMYLIVRLLAWWAFR